MRKTLHSPQHQAFLTLLRSCREDAGVTQVELASKLGFRQTDISKSERGVRRLDVVELRAWLQVLGLSLAAFAERLDEQFEAIDALKQRATKKRFPG